MQFFLGRDEPVALVEKFPLGIKGKCASMRIDYQVSKDTPGYNHNLSEELRTMLSNFHEHIDMDVRIILTEPYSLCRAILQLHEERPYLKRVIKFPGVESVKVIAKTQLLEQSSGKLTPPNALLITKEMVVIDDPEKICQDSCLQFPNKEWYNFFLERDVAISGRTTIEVVVNLKKPEQSVSSQLVVFKKMLNEEILSDLDIITNDGKIIKCHKSVLSACSPVFQRMFQTEMTENQTSTVEIPDMAENVARAFLEFVYYLKDEKAHKDSHIAVELWLAADKYGVSPDLKSAMSDILLSKPEEWYNVDVAVRLFQMARNVVGAEQLKTKAVQVLKRHVAVLDQSTVYKEMFEKNPAAAMEFVRLFTQHTQM